MYKEKDQSVFPLVSVVVPVYNVFPYLNECLDSVINQTFDNMEIIVVDDGATDGSGSVCDEYAAKDSRIRVIHKKNGGLGNARNVGMDFAQGKYIIFLDSDDYWDLDAIKILYGEAEKNETQVLMFSLRAFPDGVDPSRWPEKLSIYKVFDKEVKNGVKSMIAVREAGETGMTVCRRLFLTSYLNALKIRFPEGVIHEDEAFSFLTYIRADRVERMSTVLYFRRFRNGSILTSKSASLSAQGYAVALNGVLSDYDIREKQMSEPERTLYVLQMKLYYDSICSLYSQIIRSKNTYKAHELANNVQPFLKQARKPLKLYLSKIQLLSTYSLWVGYWFSHIYYGTRHRLGLVIRRILR